MDRLNIEVVENATKTVNIMPETPLEKVVADCMTDYLEMRKAEEQGLLVKLPCKVGDTVYKPNPITLNEIVEIIIESIFITVDKVNISGRTSIRKYSFCCSSSDFGKTVFLTTEEAEKALAEMKGV